MASGNNQTYISKIDGGSSATVSWTVTFPKNGSYTLQVQVSGYDSNSDPCTDSQSKSINVGEVSPQPPLELYIVLAAGASILIMLLIAELILRRCRLSKPTGEFKQGKISTLSE